MKQLKKISEFKNEIIEKKELQFFYGGDSAMGLKPSLVSVEDTSRTYEEQTGDASGPQGCDCGYRLDGHLIITRGTGTGVVCE